MTGQPPLTLVDLAALPVSKLERVGPRKLESMDLVGIRSLLDLLTWYPRRYLDRSRESTIAELAAGEEALVLARVVSVESRRVRNHRVMVTAEFRDRSGRLRCTFFNQPWRKQQLEQLVGDVEIAVFGRLELFQGRRQMTNPVIDPVGDRTGRIIPVYPQSEKARLSTWDLAEWIGQTLRRCAPRGIADPLPDEIRRRLGLIGRELAFTDIHQPADLHDVHAARNRLVFDELLRLQLALVRRKRELESSSLGIEHAVGPRAAGAVVPGLVDRFLDALPYALTGAQRRAGDEIADDLARPLPMHRLLQGDVGAGKTVVAVEAMLASVQGGHQAALMAPTEVLAEQHAQGIRSMLSGLTIDDDGSLLGNRPVEVALLTGRTPAAERRRILAGLADGSIPIAIGTHALIEDAVQFASLGVVVIDEQHRFGVEQRAALRDVGPGDAVPDVLVMTATPIPRTAAMTVFGDLDLTVLDELPPGRTPITTEWLVGDEGEAAAWELVRAEVGAGRRAYIVCPLIEESAKLEASSAEEVHDRLSAGPLAGLEVGLLHGRMKADDKQDVMDRFRAVSIEVLVATTVIEVGVDVPEATVMVVLDADRFGIAQLHQLRGRVGRGTAASRCVLLTAAPPGPDGSSRLEALVRTRDGFELAEIDLDLRGEGTVMGDRQKGRSDLRLASLRRDREWVEAARAVALELVDATGVVTVPELAAELTLLDAEDEAFLTKS